MPFKQGKDNAYSVLKRKVKKLEDELVYERSTKPMLTEFAERMGNDIMAILANTPYSRWPEIAKTVLTHRMRITPTLAMLYKDHHRKINGE